VTAADAASAQMHVEAQTLACVRCEVRVTPVVLLGDDEGPGIIESEQSRVKRDRRGRYYLISTYSTTVKVFDSTGTYLTSIGRTGGGPGEFRRISAIAIDEGDTLHVFDYDLGRLTVFSPTYELVRSVRLEIPPSFDVVPVGGGSFVFATHVASAELAGLPLHLVGPDGNVKRSFGSETGEYRPDVPFAGRRVIAKARASGVWSGYVNQYVIELWDHRTGSLVRRITREADWFPPRLRVERLSAREPPAPTLVEVREDSESRVWTLVHVAGEGWEEAVREGEYHPLVSDRDLYYDSLIEVLDTSSGALIASLRFPLHLGEFVADGLFGAVIYDQDLNPRFAVWRVELWPTPRNGRNHGR
jgi:hypothetical protein